jgi:hypothetical protein
MAQKKSKQGKAPVASSTPPAFLANGHPNRVIPPDNPGPISAPGNREDKSSIKHH